MYCMNFNVLFSQFHSLAPMYYRGSAAAVIVYDITKLVSEFRVSLLLFRYFSTLKMSHASPFFSFRNDCAQIYHDSKVMMVYTLVFSHGILRDTYEVWINLCFSLINVCVCWQDSFQTLKKWVKELKEHGPEDIVVAIAGNKNDLGDIRLIKPFASLVLRTRYIQMISEF